MRNAYRSIHFNDERKWKTTSVLDDILKVGTLKALGYVASSSTHVFKENGIDHDLDKLAIDLNVSGKFVATTYVDRPNEVWVGDDKKLWVGDQKMMRVILNKNVQTLSKHNWPFTPKDFFNRIINTNISHEENPEMYHIVCDLFNSWCLWCEPTTWVKQLDGSTQPFSVNPYDPDAQ